MDGPGFDPAATPPPPGAHALREVLGVRQIPGEPQRRWFSSGEFDLIVWISGGQDYAGFELCYDKAGHERCLLWSEARGFAHMAVDDGERRLGRHKQAPILVPDDSLDVRRVRSAFLEVSRSLPQEVANFVLRVLERHPDFAR